jgi:hypothetical protein
MASPLIDFAKLGKNYTKATVKLLHHDLEVALRKEGEVQVLVPSTAPAIKATIDPAASMLLLNKIAMYLGRAKGAFDEATLDLLETWYSKHCNAVMARTQCSLLGLEPKGDKATLVARLLAAKARPMLPGFISAWLAAHAELVEGKRAAGAVTFTSPELEAAIDFAPPTAAGGNEEMPPPPSMSAVLAKIAALEAKLAAAASSEPLQPLSSTPDRSSLYDPAVLAQLMTTAAEAAAAVALKHSATKESESDGKQAAAAKLSPIARLEKQALDAMVEGVYLHLPMLAKVNRERLRRAGLSPRKKTKVGEMTFYSEVELDYVRKMEDPCEVVLYQQGWDALIELLMAQPEEVYPKAKVGDLVKFKKALNLRRHPDEHKVDFVDAMFKEYPDRVGEWAALARADVPLNNDILRDGHGPCAEALALRNLAASRTRAPRAQPAAASQISSQQHTASPSRNQRRRQNRAAAAGAGGAGTSAPPAQASARGTLGGPPGNPSKMRLCRAHANPSIGPCNFTAPNGGPCGYVHECPCCPGQRHIASACPNWDQAKADQVRDRIYRTGR